MAFHFTSQLDAEVGQVAGAFAVSTDNLAARTALGGNSGGCLEPLLFAIVNEVFFVLDCSHDSLG